MGNSKTAVAIRTGSDSGRNWNYSFFAAFFTLCVLTMSSCKSIESEAKPENDDFQGKFLGTWQIDLQQNIEQLGQMSGYKLESTSVLNIGSSGYFSSTVLSNPEALAFNDSCYWFPIEGEGSIAVFDSADSSEIIQDGFEEKLNSKVAEFHLREDRLTWKIPYITNGVYRRAYINVHFKRISRRKVSFEH